MLQKLSVDQRVDFRNSEWIKEFLTLINTSYKAVMKKLMKGIFLKLVFNILKNYMNFIKIYHFHQKE